MTRTEALALAQQTVTQMSTNARGYQDQPFDARVSAVLRIAEFLTATTGENTDDDRT
ncbi:hypothetical protein [Streptomyces sp. NRRL WC-3742]|uniref:hypothetical protein n=1 Tax=Streptomyces sp. NRRL WC-3742 TaxID=1463934 RepID=UPI000A663F07|nr:hypothetical protein [Streptomyces sp. NRRL WC-3742]